MSKTIYEHIRRMSKRGRAGEIANKLELECDVEDGEMLLDCESNGHSNKQLI